MGLVLDEYGVCVESVLYVCGKGPGRIGVWLECYSRLAAGDYFMTAQDWLTHARLLEDMIASEAIQLCMHGVVDGTSMAASGFSPSGRRCSPVFFLAFWITVASR